MSVDNLHTFTICLVIIASIFILAIILALVFILYMGFRYGFKDLIEEIISSNRTN